MSDLVTGHDTQALALLAALGLTPEDHVVSLKLTLTGKGYATVEVERYVTTGQLDQVVTEVARYKLVPQEDQA